MQMSRDEILYQIQMGDDSIDVCEKIVGACDGDYTRDSEKQIGLVIVYMGCL